MQFLGMFFPQKTKTKQWLNQYVLRGGPVYEYSNQRECWRNLFDSLSSSFQELELLQELFYCIIFTYTANGTVDQHIDSHKKAKKGTGLPIYCITRLFHRNLLSCCFDRYYWFPFSPLIHHSHTLKNCLLTHINTHTHT